MRDLRELHIAAASPCNKRKTIGFLAAIALSIFGGLVRAEVSEIKIATQPGLSALPLLVMEDSKLLEKHAKAAGLGEVKVEWARLTNGPAMNDALLAGNLHFALAGVPVFAILWDKTHGNLNVKGVTATASYRLLLNTRNPAVTTIKDFSAKDKIAIPAVKVSLQALILQMAAERAFGEGNHNKLDTLAVGMSLPDGMAALLSGAHEVNSHFAAPPFQFLELANAGIHTVLDSDTVLGGPASVNIVYATSKFAVENPRTYQAFVKAFKEATEIINADKRSAALTYVRLVKDKATADDILKILNDPGTLYSMAPAGVMKYVNFMHKTGVLKQRPNTWKELFFPDIHGLSGS